MPDLRVEQPKSLVTIVEERLRNAIIDAEMGFGESLSEEALSEALGVSRTPVREALARLQLQGLVTIVPKKGTFVFAPTEEDVAEPASSVSCWRRRPCANAWPRRARRRSPR